MMAGNPNLWSMNGMQFVYGSNSSISASNAAADHYFPVRPWSQLLLGGLGGGGEEEKFGGSSLFQQQKKLENWEDQLLNLNPSFPRIDNEKQENAQPSCLQLYEDDEFQPNKSSNSWLHNHQVMPVSSPTSCITTLSNSILNFSGGEAAAAAVAEGRTTTIVKIIHPSTSTGGVSKKARVHQSSAQPALKVRKEKLGDRITALHQIVSPFGKTDTASVLSEAIGYIRFLQTQIEALSSPYMRNGSVGTSHHPQQSDAQSRGVLKDLRSRGLCLVPISCTQNVGNDNGADYWAPTALGVGGGF